MKDVTRLVNDDKRNQERAQQMLEMRERIDGLAQQEAELGALSRFLIMKQAVLKISNGRAQERHLFLTDKMLVYARENAVKRGWYQLKGRILLEQLEVHDAGGEKEAENAGGVMKYAWVIVRRDLNGKRYTIVNRALKDKKQWMEEIARAKGAKGAKE